MVITILSLILFFIFSILSSFHFFWLFGGTWGVKSVIPTKSDQINSLEIPKIATLFVALVLASFGIMYLIKSGLVIFELPYWLKNVASWIIPSIFIIRAIGDFKYLGFFKTLKTTDFAKADSKLFSPLCLGIGSIGFMIQFMM